MAAPAASPAKTNMQLALGLGFALMGLYVATADDAPGAGVIGFLLLSVAVVIATKATRRRLPLWTGRAVLALGFVVAALTAFLIHAHTVAGPLFAAAPDVPSASASVPVSQWASAVDRARPLVRAAILEQNLPGVSVAVGIGGNLVWAEGFGWRDVETAAPVTPQTRFNIGTAARVVIGAGVTSLSMPNTGTEPATAWSPEHVGEPEEDFPLFRMIRDVILRPLGIGGAAQPLAGDRATFYVPRTDDNDPRTGREPMYMRDLACCAEGLALYSTPSDLVHLGLATKTENVNGELAGGMVTSLVAGHDDGLVVAVTSNMAYADTAALALKVADAFTAP